VQRAHRLLVHAALRLCVVSIATVELLCVVTAFALLPQHSQEVKVKRPHIGCCLRLRSLQSVCSSVRMPSPSRLDVDAKQPHARHSIRTCLERTYASATAKTCAQACALACAVAAWSRLTECISCLSVETFNKSVENMMSIKSFVEIWSLQWSRGNLNVGCYLRPRLSVTLTVTLGAI
jgi:hypothetical protein